MAKVASAPIREVLKPMQSRPDQMTPTPDRLRREVSPARVRRAGSRRDADNIHVVPARHDARPERIERRLALADAH